MNKKDHLPQSGHIKKANAERFYARIDALPVYESRFHTQRLRGIDAFEAALLYRAHYDMTYAATPRAIGRQKLLELVPFDPRTGPQGDVFAARCLTNLARSLAPQILPEYTLDKVAMGTVNGLFRGSLAWMTQGVDLVVRNSKNERWAVLFRSPKEMPQGESEVSKIVAAEGAYIAGRCKGKKVDVKGVLVVSVKFAGQDAILDWSDDSVAMGVLSKRIASSLSSRRYVGSPKLEFVTQAVPIDRLPMNEVITIAATTWKTVVTGTLPSVVVETKPLTPEEKVQQAAAGDGFLFWHAVTAEAEKNKELHRQKLVEFALQDASSPPSHLSTEVAYRGLDQQKAYALLVDKGIDPNDCRQMEWRSGDLVNAVANRQKNPELPPIDVNDFCSPGELVMAKLKQVLSQEELSLIASPMVVIRPITHFIPGGKKSHNPYKKDAEALVESYANSLITTRDPDDSEAVPSPKAPSPKLKR